MDMLVADLVFKRSNVERKKSLMVAFKATLGIVLLMRIKVLEKGFFF